MRHETEQDGQRPFVIWVILGFMAVSIIMMILGQTMAVFFYDWTVQYGLQESVEEVGLLGVEVNRSFGAADSVIYVPLMVASLIGLLKRKNWSLYLLAAVGGVSFYWTATVTFIMLFFAPGTPNYTYVPGIEIWIFVGAHFIFGVLAIASLIIYRDRLIA
ncbi:MAG: hypothetical protein HKN33_08830 [Pyrinomonadaceae bacterium]|nr:hypothetical protein [Pyrinomonadaceae bacterium]